MSRVALVTGAASGIGAEVAVKLRHSGWSVVGVDRDSAIEGEGGLVADLATKVGNWNAVEDTVQRFGRLDAVIANAGFQYVAPIEDMPEDRWDAIVAILLTSPFLLAKYAWPHLKQAGAGRFIAIASAHGLTASPWKAPYVSAKHGVVGLVKTLALEGAPHGISATALCPGYVRTPLVEAQVVARARENGISEGNALADVILSRQAVKRLIEPSEVAAAVDFLVSPEASSFTGAALAMDNGWTAG